MAAEPVTIKLAGDLAQAGVAFHRVSGTLTLRRARSRLYNAAKLAGVSITTKSLAGGRLVVGWVTEVYDEEKSSLHGRCPMCKQPWPLDDELIGDEAYELEDER